MVFTPCYYWPVNVQTPAYSTALMSCHVRMCCVHLSFLHRWCLATGACLVAVWQPSVDFKARKGYVHHSSMRRLRSAHSEPAGTSWVHASAHGPA